MGAITGKWQEALAPEFRKPYYRKLYETVRREYATRIIYPPSEDLFSAYEATPLENVKAVILGQDPYHEPGQAHGMCFSVKPGVEIPPSLQNIYQELHDDLGCDIPAFVVKKQTVPMIIGSSAFSSLGDVTREGDRIVIGDLEDVESIAGIVDPVDSLRIAAQAHLEADEYAEAASCFSALRDMGALNMLTEYQYAVLLNLLGRDEENIEVSSGWLASNEGKSLTMDYWIHNGLGASHARLGNNAEAIKNLETAAQAYYSLFNTSAKAVKAGNFKDMNLGSTLYHLGRLYAAEGNVRQTENCCALAAKCGYQSAIEFCDRYKIKY